METLKDRFRKNGLDYCQLDRNNKYVLYELTTDGIIVGYEVARIRINKAGDRFGKHFIESESLPSNEQFGMDGRRNERSKAFFPAELNRAQKYLNLPIRLRFEALSAKGGSIPSKRLHWMRQEA